MWQYRHFFIAMASLAFAFFLLFRFFGDLDWTFQVNHIYLEGVVKDGATTWQGWYTDSTERAMLFAGILGWAAMFSLTRLQGRLRLAPLTVLGISSMIVFVTIPAAIDLIVRTFPPSNPDGVVWLYPLWGGGATLTFYPAVAYCKQLLWMGYSLMLASAYLFAKARVQKDEAAD